MRLLRELKRSQLWVKDFCRVFFRFTQAVSLKHSYEKDVINSNGNIFSHRRFASSKVLQGSICLLQVEDSWPETVSVRLRSVLSFNEARPIVGWGSLRNYRSILLEISRHGENVARAKVSDLREQSGSLSKNSDVVAVSREVEFILRINGAR